MSPETILSLSPSSSQIGFGYFEAGQLVDWGVKNLDSEPILERIFKKGLRLVVELTVRFNPQTIILPTLQADPRRANRQKFIRATQAILSSSRQSVAFCSDREVRDLFRVLLGVRPTVQQMAIFLAGVFPELQPMVPKPRRPWESQDYWTLMFDAVARGFVWIHSRRDQ